MTTPLPGQRSVTELRPYQVEDLTFYIANERCANLSDPGTGKTPSVCVYIRYLIRNRGIKVLWVMPKSLLVKNREELLRFTDLDPEEIVIIDGTPKKRAEQMAQPAGVFLLGGDRFRDDWEHLKNTHPEIDAVVVDEIHMIFKTATSKRTKELFRAMRKIKVFLAMTGSLISGRLDSAYPTIHVIEPRYYYDRWSFLMQHAIMDDAGKVLGWTNHAKLGLILKKHTIRRTFESIYGDQEIVAIRRQCEMSPPQREAYDEFEEDAILELDDYFLTGIDPGVKAIRARQIMAHPETFGIGVGVPTGKDEALAVELADHWNRQEPLLIYAALVPEQERIVKLCRSHGFRTGLINGSVSAPERSRLDEAFRKGEIDVLVASAATAAVGFNWSHIDHIIFASIDYLDVNVSQAIRRAIRGTRTKPLRVTFLEYTHSIDQRIFSIVTRKSASAHQVDDSYGVLNFAKEVA